jgi:hypothetical protein
MIKYCYVTGDVSGSGRVAGVADTNNGTIENCSVEGKVSSRSGDSVGGVTYNNSGTGVIQNCYVTGEVSGKDYVGGVAGYNNGGRVQNCYVTGDVEGKNEVGGVAGRIRSGIYNCVALNEKITSDGSVGRIYGYLFNTSYFDRNYARNDMTVTVDNVTVPCVENNQNGTNIEDEANYNNGTWWTTAGTWGVIYANTSRWNFTNIWYWDTVEKLPKLLDVGVQP